MFKLNISRLALLAVGLTVFTAARAQEVRISGAGATFPYPVYSKWFAEYNRQHPDIKINYQGIGSGGGIRQFSEGTVDFGATDGPMTNDQINASKVQPVLHLPMVLGGVVPAYNLPLQGLHFSGPVLAEIFLGKITRWDDKKIAADNPGAALPDLAISVVHRADGSGTSYIWVDYLSKVSREWKEKVGVGTSVTWPVGLGGKGNEGVAGTIKQIPGAIGYVELIYARQNKINFGAVRNAAGEFVTADLESVTAAASTAKIPSDYRVSITNAPGKGVYPISSFTWLLVTPNMKDKAKKAALHEFLEWAITDGQAQARAMDYAPLPAEVVGRLKKDIERMK